jgi:cytochrome c biogenesis protein CcmG/thiol:disulfide interchange protein DsbE
VRSIGAAIAAVLISAVTVLAVGGSASADRPLPRFKAQPLRPADPLLTDQLVRGHGTVLVFWASWCEPCQKEIPAVAARLRPAGVTVIGVDTNDRRSDAIAFLEANHSTALASAFDDTGSVATAFGLYGLPATVFIGADGEVVAKHIGPTGAGDIVRFAASSSR